MYVCRRIYVSRDLFLPDYDEYFVECLRNKGQLC